MKRVTTSISSLLLVSFFSLLMITSCSKLERNNPFDLTYDLVAPTEFTVAQVMVSQCMLEWQDESTIDKTYIIDRKIGDDGWQEGYAEVAGDTRLYIDTDLTYNSTHSYRIYAACDENCSSTLEGSTEVLIPAPSNLTYSVQNASPTTVDITLNWNYAMEGIDGFRIKKNGELLDEVIPAETTEWGEADMLIGTNVSYKVVAFYQSHNSQNSNTVSVDLSIPGMVFVQGGNFEMGDHHGIGEADELPVHNVILDDFCIAEKEVTYFECIEFLNDFGVEGDGSYQGVSYIDVNDADCAISYNGSFYFESNGLNSNIQCAVSEVRWHGAVAFCNWLSQKDGLTACYDLSTWECNYDANGYRLPTEAEWEYAARGGIHWEDNYIYSGCGSNDIDDYLWYDNNSSSAIHIGGLLQPNQLGIYDMSGNVFEWCNDWYYNTYYSNSPEDNPTGPNNGTYKIARGGSWDQSSTESRVANRTKHLPDSSSYNNGFRYVRGF